MKGISFLVASAAVCALLAACSATSSAPAQVATQAAAPPPAAAPLVTDPVGGTCDSLDGQGYCPGDDPATAAAASAPAGTVSEQQALAAAEGYLNMGSGFSRQGLIDQLDSSAGNGFSVADATWAVDHSDADWDAQAGEAAQGYMKLGGFSRDSLIAQLTSSSGSQFTEAQAEYAADKVGL